MEYKENGNKSSMGQNNSPGKDGQAAGGAGRPGAGTENGKAAPAGDAGTKDRDTPEFRVPSFLDVEKAREKNGNPPGNRKKAAQDAPPAPGNAGDDMGITAAQAGPAGKTDAAPQKVRPAQAGGGSQAKRKIPGAGEMAGKGTPVAPASRETAGGDVKGMENAGRKNGREDRNQPGPGSFHVIDLDDKEDPPVLEEAGAPAAPVMRIYTGRQENRAGGREMPQEGGHTAGTAPLPRMPGVRPAAPSAATPAAPSGRAGDTSGDSIRHAMPGGVTLPSGREGDMPADRAGTAYDAGSDAYVRFMDDVQWEIIRAIGEEGISVYRDIEGRIRQGHREFTNSRIRTSLKLLEGHGFVATGKSVGPSGRNCTICMLTDAGMKIFRWKYGKAPAIPEAGRKAGDGAPRPADPLEGPAAQEGLPAVKRSYGSVHAREETPPDGPGAEKISVTIRDRSAAKDIIGRKGRFSPWDFVAFRTGDDSEPVCGYLISTKRGEIEVGTLDSGVRKYSTKHVHGMHHIVVVAEYPAGDQILRVTAHNKAGLYGFIGELILADADKGAVKDFAERFGIAEDLAEFL